MANYYKQIKTTLVKNEAYKIAKDYSKNRSDLRAYYEVGKLLIKAQGGEKRNKYGNQLIAEYSQKLTQELGKGYSVRNLYNMRLFYLMFQYQILQTLSAKLSWSHYSILINLKNEQKIKYYIAICEDRNLSVRELRECIKNKDYERLPSKTREKLAENKPTNLQDTVKDPIIIKKNGDYREFSEKVLRQLILEDLEHFLKELGDGFTFVGSEYKIKIGENYHYIDLLLYNIQFNCYVVIELKITEFKAEYIGQVQKYMHYIDKHLKDTFRDDTIGIIIAKRKDKFVLEYCSDPRIQIVEWRLD